MKEPNELGLSLSGGGYRAAAFHLGTLKKLKELGILEKTEVLSTISGGSITGAAWLLSEEDYNNFHARFKKNLETKNVIKYVLTRFRFLIAAVPIFIGLAGCIILSFTSFSYISFPLFGIVLFLIFRFQYHLLPLSKLIEKAYDRFFYNGADLTSIKKNVKMVIGSSNLHTGKPFTFSKDKMGDSYYNSEKIKFTTKGFPISRAVAASSCVPFAFSPVFIDDQFIIPNDEPSKSEMLKDTQKCVESNNTSENSVAKTTPYKAKPQLIDGGVYDNQGIHKLTESKSSFCCSHIIVSDAGGSFMKDLKYNNTISLLIRTVDLFMYRIKAFQMRKNIYWNVSGDERPIAYISLGWEPEKCITGFVDNLEQGNILPKVIDIHELDKSWLEEIDKPGKKFTCETREKIIAKLKSNIAFDAIPKISREDWIKTCAIGTNLTPLSKNQTNCLIQHAESITEIQIKLYCPMLL
ncbi:patatin-like phospholipase family protein [Flavobacterium procerum]|uniref:Patatin-like phospholipase family protein n=1 Tax=Flavobacterium procerum TaxID=1455569 RepID=A0ABV6BQI1_9FLAO